MSFIPQTTPCASCIQYREGFGPGAVFIEHQHTEECLHRHHPGCRVGSLPLEKQRQLSSWVDEELKSGRERAREQVRKLERLTIPRKRW